MQLDVEESTPAGDMAYWLHSRIATGNCRYANTCNLVRINFTHWVTELWPFVKPTLVQNFGLDTDRRPDKQKAMHMSPPCLGMGVSKNLIKTDNSCSKWIPWFYQPCLSTFNVLVNIITLKWHGDGRFRMLNQRSQQFFKRRIRVQKPPGSEPCLSAFMVLVNAILKGIRLGLEGWRLQQISWNIHGKIYQPYLSAFLTSAGKIYCVLLWGHLGALQVTVMNSLIQYTHYSKWDKDRN